MPKSSQFSRAAKARVEADPVLAAKVAEVDAALRAPYAKYQFNPKAFIEEVLGWTPWAGDEKNPGQVEILDAYTQALRQQFEQRDYELGQLTAEDLLTWTPGEIIRNWIRAEAGHTVGKTMILSGIVLHFMYCFGPSIIYTFAPTWKQIKKLLWKEIGKAHDAAKLPGRVLETCELKLATDHFAQGLAASNAEGKGSERVQGQHGPFLLFVLDEAEGVADFVYEAIDSMDSGGIVIVLMAANPRTQTSEFHKRAALPEVASFRMSCIHHPNVLADRELVPGAVRRRFVERMLRKHCEIVTEHNEDDQTFEVPWRPGVIYRPNAVFMWRVMGIAPANMAVDTFIPVGRYEAAVKRGQAAQPAADADTLTAGIDVARFGDDRGKLYLELGGVAWCARDFDKQDSTIYYQRTKESILKARAEAAAKGIILRKLYVRVDAGGGFGGGVVDQLRRDQDLKDAFSPFVVYEVHNNGVPKESKSYADLGTEMYALMAERLKVVALRNPPEALAIDLCERPYDWTTKRGVSVRVLTDKKKFRKDFHHSPDDGDGLALCLAPAYLFAKPAPALPQSYSFGH